MQCSMLFGVIHVSKKFRLSWWACQAVARATHVSRQQSDSTTAGSVFRHTTKKQWHNTQCSLSRDLSWLFCPLSWPISTSPSLSLSLILLSRPLPRSISSPHTYICKYRVKVSIDKPWHRGQLLYCIVLKLDLLYKWLHTVQPSVERDGITTTSRITADFHHRTENQIS